MAVAKNQIQEILEIVWYEMPQGGTRRTLRRLMKTEAYKRNKSFKDTIDRMLIADRMRTREGVKQKVRRKNYDDEHRVGF